MFVRPGGDKIFCQGIYKIYFTFMHVPGCIDQLVKMGKTFYAGWSRPIHWKLGGLIHNWTDVLLCMWWTMEWVIWNMNKPMVWATQTKLQLAAMELYSQSSTLFIHTTPNKRSYIPLFVWYTVIWKNFVWIIFVCKIFVLKYFRGCWQLTIIKHTKCILYTNIRVFNVVRLPRENILTTNISQITV